MNTKQQLAPLPHPSAPCAPLPTRAASHLPRRQRAAAAAAHLQAAGHAQRGGVARRDQAARLARVPAVAPPEPRAGMWLQRLVGGCASAVRCVHVLVRMPSWAGLWSHHHSVLTTPPCSSHRVRSSRGCAPTASTCCSACLSTTPPSASRWVLGVLLLGTLPGVAAMLDRRIWHQPQAAPCPHSHHVLYMPR